VSQDKGALEFAEEHDEHARTAASCILHASRAMRGEILPDAHGRTDIERATYWLSLAQIHATLANAAATRLMVERYDCHNTPSPL
jgi:hypothetical protein